VTSRGSVDWLCLPRFDSAAVFARLLDDDAGHFTLAPAGPGYRPTWTYRPDSLVLETTWTSPGSTLVVTDALALGSRERGHDLGFNSPGVLLRRARCLQGPVRVDVEFVPRPEFGLVHPRLSRIPGGVVGDGGSTVTILSTDRPLHLSAGRATAQVTLHPGQDVTFAVEQIDAWGPPPRPWSPGRIRRRLSGTESSWRSWSGLHQAYDGPWRDLVRHSGRVLRGLTNARSGARGGGGHYQPARGGGQRPHLGLPLHLGARRQHDPPGSVRRGMPARGRCVFRLPRARGRHSARAGPAPADHVRRRRRTRPARARAGAPARMAGQWTSSCRQRRVAPAPARRLRCPARRRVDTACPTVQHDRVDSGVPGGRGAGRSHPLG